MRRALRSQPRGSFGAKERCGAVASAVALACAAAALPLLSLADPELNREARALNAVCAHCHNLQVVTDTPRSYDEWVTTVQKMVDHGARGTDAQFDDIMDYLHRTLTTINVNEADQTELQTVLGVSEPVADRIVARRMAKPFVSLDDLKSVADAQAAALEARSKLIFFH